MTTPSNPMFDDQEEVPTLGTMTKSELIARLAERYPGYGLERHAGYGTALHRSALEQQGLTPLHRRSFLRKVLAAQPSS